jgi:hypothetical protein
MSFVYLSRHEKQSAHLNGRPERHLALFWRLTVVVCWIVQLFERLNVWFRTEAHGRLHRHILWHSIVHPWII